MTRTTGQEATPSARRGRRAVAVACGLALALVPARAADARLGDLDPGFDGDGVAMPNVGAAASSRWGDGRGRFRTRGRYGAATVRGTKWLTLDRCDGTNVRVVRGKLAVQDLVHPNRGPELVRAGGKAFVPYKRAE